MNTDKILKSISNAFLFVSIILAILIIPTVIGSVGSYEVGAIEKSEFYGRLGICFYMTIASIISAIVSKSLR